MKKVVKDNFMDLVGGRQKERDFYFCCSNDILKTKIGLSLTSFFFLLNSFCILRFDARWQVGDTLCYIFKVFIQIF